MDQRTANQGCNWKDIDSAADIDAVAGAVADSAAGATRRRCLVAEVEENAGMWSHADCGDVKPFLVKLGVKSPLHGLCVPSPLHLQGISMARVVNRNYLISLLML